MSRIFDALQRSESERSGDKGPAAADATELLRHAEKRALSDFAENATPEYEVAAPEKPEKPEKTVARNGRGRSSNGASGAAHGSRSSAAAAAEPALAGEHPAIFDQFQMLRVSVPAQGRLVSISDRDSAAAEAFRLLAVRLRNLRRDRPLKKVLVTSSIPQEGKSMCSANLACSLALRAPQRTLLLEGDIRRPSMAPMFGLAPRPGLSEFLREDRELKDSIYLLEGPGLWFMTAGSAPSNSLELLQSAKLSRLLDQLGELFDWIVIDSPPVLPLADTSVWSRLCDGVLLVTRRGVSEKREMLRAVDALESQKLIGAILNSSNNTPHADYYYNSRPGKGSS
ncbi:MAG TPA: CpsD/CapB family tyrosine-protein kinase [Acidobacteriaceae bacterium]|nr:CpsD/CapB family tyrosine-protein kinase [Acidobacteriaceae bacterium]